MTKSMKTKIFCLSALFLTGAASAIILSQFASWDEVKKNSPDIAVVQCIKVGHKLQPLYNYGPVDYNASVKIIFVLRGATNVTSALLWTSHPLKEGEGYLIFGSYETPIPRTKIKLPASGLGSEQEKLIPTNSIREGDYYLVVGAHETGRETGVYKAFEDYRIVPLGTQFSTNGIAGQSLDEQIRTLFEGSVDHLNHQIGSEQAERDRIASGIVKK